MALIGSLSFDATRKSTCQCQYCITGIWYKFDYWCIINFVRNCFVSLNLRLLYPKLFMFCSLLKTIRSMFWGMNLRSLCWLYWGVCNLVEQLIPSLDELHCRQNIEIAVAVGVWKSMKLWINVSGREKFPNTKRLSLFISTVFASAYTSHHVMNVIKAPPHWLTSIYHPSVYFFH